MAKEADVEAIFEYVQPIIRHLCDVLRHALIDTVYDEATAFAVLCQHIYRNFNDDDVLISSDDKLNNLVTLVAVAVTMIEYRELVSLKKNGVNQG